MVPPKTITAGSPGSLEARRHFDFGVSQPESHKHKESSEDDTDSSDPALQVLWPMGFDDENTGLVREALISGAIPGEVRQID